MALAWSAPPYTANLIRETTEVTAPSMSTPVPNTPTVLAANLAMLQTKPIKSVMGSKRGHIGCMCLTFLLLYRAGSGGPAHREPSKWQGAGGLPRRFVPIPPLTHTHTHTMHTRTHVQRTHVHTYGHQGRTADVHLMVVDTWQCECIPR